MNTTTKTNRKVIVLSWIVAIVACAVFAWAIYYAPVPVPAGTLKLPEGKQPIEHRGALKPRAVKVAKLSEKMKAEQAQRTLPSRYAEQLVEQSEMSVKKSLKSQLLQFQKMAEKMRSRKESLLSQVEARKLPRSAPKDANDVSAARKIPKAGNPPLGSDPSVQDIYEMLRQYEREIQQNHLAVNAAKQTLQKGLSFPEVYKSLQQSSTRMPDFEELIAMQTGGADWERSGRSNASAGLSVRSTADLNNYRGLLSQASRQAGLAGSRLESLFGLVRNVGKPGNAAGNGKGNGNGGGAGGGTGDGGGGGDGGLGGVNYENNEVMTPYSKYRGPRLNESMVKAQALPGRRFSKDAERKGWLYVNTWYMIGPWENYGRDDFAIIHQPEISVDFDAVYTDGQVGVGIEETESDPIKMIGKEVKLDGTLRWKFMQSESMHTTVPGTTGHSTYYAYTELYFDEATTMLVAIGTDDSGRIWINGKDVWQDKGTSWYHIDEHIEPFTFQQGWNRVLLRLENGGGGAAGFSFLIIPQDHAVTTD